MQVIQVVIWLLSTAAIFAKEKRQDLLLCFLSHNSLFGWDWKGVYSSYVDNRRKIAYSHVTIPSSQRDNLAQLNVDISRCDFIVGEHMPSIEAYARKNNKIYLLQSPPDIPLEKRMLSEPDRNRTMFSAWPSWETFFKESMKALIKFKRKHMMIDKDTGSLGNILIISHYSPAYFGIASELQTLLAVSPAVSSVRHITVKPGCKDELMAVFRETSVDNIVYMFDHRGTNFSADTNLVMNDLYDASIVFYHDRPEFFIWDMTAFYSDRFKLFVGEDGSYTKLQALNMKHITMNQCIDMPKKRWNCNDGKPKDMVPFFGMTDVTELLFYLIYDKGLATIGGILKRIRHPNWRDATVSKQCFSPFTLGRSFKHGFRIFTSIDIVRVQPTKYINSDYPDYDVYFYKYPRCIGHSLSFYMKEWNSTLRRMGVRTTRNLTEAVNLRTEVNAAVVKDDGQEEAISRDTLKIVVVLEKPFAYKVKGGKTDNLNYRGITIEMVKTVMERLWPKVGHINYEFYVAPNNSYGSYNKDTKKWSGALGEVQSKRAIFAVGMISKTRLRKEIFEFSPSYEYVGVTFVSEKQLEFPEFTNFMGPFDTKVWWALLAVLIVSGIFIRLLDYWNPFMDTIEPDQRFNLKESLWYSFGAITQAGSAFAPVSFPLRIYSVAYWFFALVICASYTGNLASFLTESGAFTNPDKLADVPSWHTRWFTLRNSFMESFINSISKERDVPLSLAEDLEFAENYEEGVKSVKKTDNVFIGNSLLLHYYAVRDADCSLRVSPDVKGFTDLAFPMRRDYERPSWKRDFFNELQEMKHDGTTAEILERYIKYEAKCEIQEGEDSDKIKMALEHFSALYAILGGAILLSFIAVGIKLIWLKILICCRGRKEKRNKPSSDDVTEGDEEMDTLTNGTAQQEQTDNTGDEDKEVGV